MGLETRTHVLAVVACGAVDHFLDDDPLQWKRVVDGWSGLKQIKKRRICSLRWMERYKAIIYYFRSCWDCKCVSVVIVCGIGTNMFLFAIRCILSSTAHRASTHLLRIMGRRDWSLGSE